MDDKQNIIGLTELLDEVNRDLKELREKHSGDYGIKNITMWWDLERERLMTRHGSLAVVKRLRKIATAKKSAAWFFAGWVVMILFQMALRLSIA